MAEINITKDNFEQEVINSELPVLLDFWASWCGPCMMLAPLVEKIAEKYEGRLKVGKVNTDEETELAAMFRVVSIPMLVLMKDGKAVKSSVGYINESQLESFIK